MEDRDQAIPGPCHDVADEHLEVHFLVADDGICPSLFFLSGHIHESPKVSEQITDMIGSTLCVNPGQTESVLQAVTIDIPGYRVRLV